MIQTTKYTVAPSPCQGVKLIRIFELKMLRLEIINIKQKKLDLHHVLKLHPKEY